MIRGCWSLVVLGVAASLAAAQESKPEGTPVRLILRPAAQPVPALKYLFLPELPDRTPGNAALLYDRAVLMQRGHRETLEQSRQADRLMETPVAKLTADDLRQMEARVSNNVLHELALAARRQRCDWELEFRTEGVALLLPEIQGLRELARVVILRVRPQIARGKIDEAVHTLQSGFALARNTSEGSTLIQSLVGIAVGSLMCAQVEELIQAPGAPNLYWALTELPRPFVSLRHAAQGEKAMLVLSYPFLREIQTRVLTAAELRRKMLTQFAELQGDLRIKGRPDWQARLGLTALALKFYPEAKRALIAGGRKPAEVEAMPALQAVALHALAQFRRQQDELFKWLDLPYWEARPGLRRAEMLVREKHATMEGLPFSLALPAAQKVMEAQARLERRIAVLRCIEALRLYAAGHDGKLPASLAEVKEVPIPLDPMTGKPFQYRVAGDKAILSAAVPEGLAPHPTNTVNYELVIKR